MFPAIIVSSSSCGTIINTLFFALLSLNKLFEAFLLYFIKSSIPELNLKYISDFKRTFLWQ